MANITTSRIDFSAITPAQYPPVGRFIIGLDTDDIYKKMDSNGVVTIIGSGADTNTFLTGGTYNDSTGTATYTNNLGGSFGVDGFTTVTGGTYNDTTGVATYTNNLNGTFAVSGFLTGGTGGFGITDITYADLKTAYDASGMTVGYYRMTDYETIYDQPDFEANGSPKTGVTTNTSAVEVIILFASSVSTLESVVMSETYPADTIKYDITFDTTEAMGVAAKGRIYERIDTDRNRTGYDHRTVLLKRYKDPSPYSTNYNQHYDNGEISAEVLTFGTATPGDPSTITGDNYIGDMGILGVLIGYPFFIPNISFGDVSLGNKTDIASYNLTIGGNEDVEIVDNIVGLNVNNVIFGSSTIANNIGFGSETVFVGENCQSLKLLGANSDITFGDTNGGITIGEYSSTHDFGTGNLMIIIGQQSDNKTWGDNNQQVSLGDNCNTTLDFTSATHTKGDYETNIKRVQGGVERLFYYNSSYVEQNVVPTT